MIEEFRISGPFSYMLGPFIASILLALGLELSHLFLVLAGFMIIATIFPLMIKDTK